MTDKCLRRDAPKLWADIVTIWREECGDDWTDDDVASVISKVRSKEADDLLEHIGIVMAYCGAAVRSDNDEALATVALWKHPELPVIITVDDDGDVCHQIDPSVQVEILQ